LIRIFLHHPSSKLKNEQIKTCRETDRQTERESGRERERDKRCFTSDTIREEDLLFLFQLRPTSIQNHTTKV
jgi:hypothetical protein